MNTFDITLQMRNLEAERAGFHRMNEFYCDEMKSFGEFEISTIRAAGEIAIATKQFELDIAYGRLSQSVQNLESFQVQYDAITVD